MWLYVTCLQSACSFIATWYVEAHWGAKTVQRHVRKCRTALKPWSLDSEMLKPRRNDSKEWHPFCARQMNWAMTSLLAHKDSGLFFHVLASKLQLKCRMDVLTAKCRMVWNQRVRESQRQTRIHFGCDCSSCDPILLPMNSCGKIADPERRLWNILSEDSQLSGQSLERPWG